MADHLLLQLGDRQVVYNSFMRVPAGCFFAFSLDMLGSYRSVPVV